MSPIQVRPERFVAGGEALARGADGRVIFVRGGLPGELVDVELTEEKPDFSRAVTTLVREPSAERVIPPCPNRLAGCGGCSGGLFRYWWWPPSPRFSACAWRCRICFAA